MPPKWVHRLSTLKALQKAHLAYRDLFEVDEPEIRLLDNCFFDQTLFFRGKTGHIQIKDEKELSACLRVWTDCSGLEAPCMALEELGIPFKSCFSSEVNERMRRMTQSNFGTKNHIPASLTDRMTLLVSLKWTCTYLVFNVNLSAPQV